MGRFKILTNKTWIVRNLNRTTKNCQHSLEPDGRKRVN